MRCGGFQKCVVSTRSGRVQRAAMAVMLRPEVLDASTASGRASASMRAKRSCFHAMSSGPDSTTRSAWAIDWSKSVGPVEQFQRALHLRGPGQLVIGQHPALRPGLFQSRAARPRSG